MAGKRKTMQSPVPSGTGRGLSELLEVVEGKRRVIIKVVFVLIAVSLLYYFKGLFVAALANGEPITRLSVVQNLEKQYGKQALENLITEILIRKKAREQGVSVTNQEVAGKVLEIEKTFSDQGQNMDDVLKLQGFSRKGLEEQIKLQLMAEKLLKDTLAIEDSEIDKYIAQNSNLLPADLKGDELKNWVRESLKQQKLSQGLQDLITKIREEANISYFVNY